MTTIEAAATSCPACAQPGRAGNRFCPRCGTVLVPSARRAGPTTVSAPIGIPPTPPTMPPLAPHVPGARPACYPAPPGWRGPLRSPPPMSPSLPAPTSSSPPQPAATPRARRALDGGPVTVVALLAVAVVAVLVAVLAIANRAPSPTSAGTVAIAAQAPSLETTAAAPASAAVSTDPQSQLGSLAASDSATIEGLAGSWVPQLSSKRPGVIADGRSYDAAAILAEHQALRSTYPGARLLWSGDFANYRGRDFWVTVLAEPMSDAASANAWCDAQNLDGEHCYAVRLTHSGGPAGNSVMRPGR